MTVDRDAMRRYEAARDEAAGVIAQIEPLLPRVPRTAVTAARERLERAKFVLAVVGEFSSGKSFLLNALLGKFRYEAGPGGAQRIVGLLATDINPSTATITELEFGGTEEANAYFPDGRLERIPLDRLSKFIAVGSDEPGKLHDATADERSAPARVVVRVNSPFLQRGFSVADTPGLASINPAHRRATLEFLPSADAVLYLIDTQQPFSEGDAAFLGIIRRHIDSIFIVQTKIDLWEQRQADGRDDWESAHDRIASLASIHAPGTYVYALSARRYIEGKLQDDSELVTRSRFQKFVDALDASLIATTGRARLRRALDQTAIATSAALRQLERNAQMLELSREELERRRSELEPAISRLQAAAKAEREQIAGRRISHHEAARDQAVLLAEETEATLAQTFDTADIARLRDRAKLHILIDRTFAEVIGAFAREVAKKTLADVETAVNSAQEVLPFDVALGDAAAHAFGSEPGTGMWAGELCDAIAAGIVLDAISGPAIALVSDVSARFAAVQPGSYMKRELTADLRAEIFPRLRDELNTFTARVATRLETLYDAVSAALEIAVETKREADLGSIDAAMNVRASSGDVAHALQENSTLQARLRDGIAALRATVEHFLAREPEIAPADPGHEAVRRTHAAPFDEAAYGLGLRPQRWRVAVLGALRRGKSSLINAIAGTRVLADEAAGTIAYPVHVRYGPQERAYALRSDGSWNEVEIESALEEATQNPVLIETPWSLPRELVLVHVPAFDTGNAQAEEIAVVAASRASESICLFSRQLSDRELDMYERIGELGKPMMFVHTIADNETTAERRQVVELAKTYLGERRIAANRVFTISTLDYAQAKREQRAPAAWNELDALISTLSAAAEAHMNRLAKLERAAGGSGPAASTPVRPDGGAPRSLFTRLFGRR